MSNPYQPPPVSAPPRSSRWLRSVVISMCVWVFFILLASAFGGLSSFYTGKAGEIPKWNGLSYFLFSAKEGAMMGAILTCPCAAIAFVVSYFASGTTKGPERLSRRDSIT